MATEVATLTFKADTKEIEAAHQELVKLNRQGKITDKTLKEFEKSMKGALKPTGKMPVALGDVGRKAGQAGIQFQQLIGQVQAGTSPMVALSQQAADLGFVLGFPLAGAVAGIAASLAGPLLSALFGVSEEVEKLSDRAEKLGIDLRAALPALFGQELDKLTETYNEATEALNRQLAVRAKTEEAINKEIKSVVVSQAEVKRLSEEFMRQTLEIETLTLAQKEALKAIEEFTKAFNAEEIKKANEALEEYIKRQEQISARKEMNIPAKMLAEASERAAEAGRELTAEERKRLLVAGVRLQQIEDEKVAKRLADEEARGSQQTIAAMRRKAHQEQLAAISAERKARQLEDQMVLQRVQEMNAAEAELRSAGLLDVERDEIDSFNRRQAKLDEFRQKQLISEKRYAEGSKNLEKQRTEFAIKSAGDALNSLGQTNKQAFKLAKAYNIGQAIMNTYTGATKALAELPPPFNFIVAAATIANGLAQVQQIRSQQFQGRAVGGQVRSGESYVVGERGPEVLTMGATGRIIPNDKIGGATQTVNKVANVNFQITTVDARGFDQLLQSRRGQIVSMVNSAMNDQGRRGVA